MRCAKHSGCIPPFKCLGGPGKLQNFYNVSVIRYDVAFSANAFIFQSSFFLIGQLLLHAH